MVGGYAINASGGGDSRPWGKGGGCVDVGGGRHGVVVVVDGSDGG